ncbi:MAG: hypothetical protein DWH99_17540 [Planctomycetota bacterium]|nr:MAG: hypothetical protein DWH99_17540 [Planctomycetota bacterium]
MTIDRISTTIQRVNFNSTSVGLPQTLEDLTTTSNGPVKLQSLSGSIVVRAGTAGTDGITANGSGDVLLETVNGGDITTHSGISSGTGSITLDAAGALDLKGMVQTLGTGSIQLASGTNTSIESIRTLGNVQILSGGDLTLGSIDAGNGRVYMQAIGSISDRDTTSNSTSVIAGSLAMRAGGKIGDSDTGAPDGSNRNAIGTQVLTLAAEAATGIYIQERDGLTVDSVIVSSQRVNFNSTRTAQVRVLEDLTTTSDGPIKLQSLAGDLVVNAGTMGTRGIAADGSGDVLLETVQVGSIITNAVVMSDQGNITVNSADSLQVVDRLRTGVSGTIYLKSQSDVAVGSLEANNDIAVIAGGNITLGRLNAGSGVVYLEAAGNILDSDPSAQTIHISASALAMRAGGKIGDSDLTYPQDSNRNAIVTRVGLIAAESANGMYVLQQEGGIVVDTVSVGVKQVNFNSTLADRSETLEDLVTTANGPIKLQSISGDILVRGGTAGTLGIRADGTGDVLLQTVLNGTVITQAQVQSRTGNITIDSVDALQVRDHLRTSNPGRIYLTSRGDVTVEALNTGNVNLAIVSDQSIRLGDIQAGTARVYLQASKDILEADPSSESINLSASALAMSAGGRIGGSDLTGPLENNRNAIGTKVDLLAARSVEGIYIREADGLTVDTVLVSSSQVNFNSSQSDRSQVLEDLTTTGSGPIKLQSVAGNIQINSGSTGPHGILSAVAGDVLLQTIDSGTVILNGVVQSEYGDITIQSKDHLVLGDRIRLGGPPRLGTIYLASQQDVTIESLMTNDSNLWVQAGRDIVLGSIQAGAAGVYLDAQRDIVNGAIVPVVNVSTRGVLAMRAGSEIGEIFTQVDTLAAVAADRITITEIDGVTIGAVQVAVEQVHFNSSQTDRVSVLEDLTTSNGGTIALRNFTGDIIVDSGRLPGTGISADGAGDIVLVTIDSGHIILRGDLVSGTGDISLGAKDSVLIGAMIRTSGDVVLESVRGAIAELNSSARVEADELTLRSASFAHLHDTTVNRLTARTLSNALLSSWQELDVQANAQGDDFVDALGTVSQSIKDALREQYRYIDRYENIGYSLYVVNSKALTIDSAVAGILPSGQGQSDKPGIYIQTRSGDLIVEDAIVSSSTSTEAGGVVLVSGSKVVLGSTATLQSNSIQNGTIHGQRINDVDLKARIFDALEKPNPAGGLFTTRIVSRNSFSESNLPEVPTSPGPTKRSLQGVATHFGSANESGFDLYIGYADGKLESFGKQGDIYVRDAGSDQPVGSKPQSLGRVGYLERSNPFDVDFLNSVQELPTDVVIRRSEDFFIFQKEPPVGFDNFNPPNGAPSTSTGYYDLTVQTHRVPDVISEGADSGLPMPPAPETQIPTFSQPEPYTVRETPTVATESPEYEDQPYQERSTRIVVKRLVVSIVEEVRGEFKEQEATKESRTDETEEILIPEGLLSGSDQLSQSDLRKIREYLRLQPGTRQGRYEITIETSDGTQEVVDRFTIGTEPRGANPTIPLDNPPNEPSKGESQKGESQKVESPEGDQESKAKENDGKPSNSNDQSLYLEPGIPTSIVPSELRHEQANDQAWSLVLGSLWLARKPNSLNVPPPTDYSVLARRLRRFRSPNQR